MRVNTFPIPMPTHAFTIAKLADAAGVNVETIRYYQRRGILSEPPRVGGGFRCYDDDHLRRLRFVRRALELGFDLDDAVELLTLSQSSDREELRSMARARAGQIRERVAQLSAMADALDHLAETCAMTTAAAPCPIVAALTEPRSASGDDCPGCAEADASVAASSTLAPDCAAVDTGQTAATASTRHCAHG